MSDKSNKYGYVGVDIPAQSFGNNKGVFNPAEINELVANNQWTSFGQLELIETQTTSSAVASVEFDDIKESEYNVHYLTMSNGMTDTGTNEIVLRFKVGGSEISSGYKYVNNLQRSNGTTTISYNASYSNIRFSTYNTAGSGISRQSSGIYIYNAGDSTKRTFTTHSSTGGENISGTIHYSSTFGGGCLNQTSVVNGIKFLQLFASNMTSNITFSLYGIRYS